MIVQCESCRSQFDVEDAILLPAGRKLKCSQCAAVFFQPPPKGGEAKSAAASASRGGAGEVVQTGWSGMDFPDQELLEIPEEPSRESESILLSEEPDDGLDGTGDILLGAEDDDIFGDLREAPLSQDAQEGFSDSFANEVDALLSKNGLIDTYMHQGVDETPPPPPPAPPVVKPPIHTTSSEEEETQLGPMPQLALAKPTARELELARLAQEKREKKDNPPPVQKVEPIVEKPEPFIRMEEKWDTGEPSLDEEEPGEAEEPPPPREPIRISRRVLALSGLLLLGLGMGLASLTDWWTFTRFDLFSNFRFSEARGEWRRYPFGMVLLVNGSVSNTSRGLQMVPGIRVELLTDEGKEVGSSLAYPGRVIDDKTLDESSEATLRTMSTLQGEDKRLRMNKLWPGNEIPYQVIFVKPPPEATRYRLQLLLPDGKNQPGKEKSLPKSGAKP